MKAASGEACRERSASSFRARAFPGTGLVRLFTHLRRLAKGMSLEWYNDFLKKVSDPPGWSEPQEQVSQPRSPPAADDEAGHFSISDEMIVLATHQERAHRQLILIQRLRS